MAGKYAGVIDKLPRFYGTDDDYQVKVDEMKKAILQKASAEQQQEVRFLPASELCTQYEDLRGSDESYKLASRDTIETIIDAFGKEGLEAMLYEINLRLEAVSQMMCDQFDVEGVSSMKLSSDARVAVQYEPYAKVDDRSKLKAWCEKNGLGDRLALPWQTLNSIVKERLLLGEPEPDGVSATSKPKIVLRRG